MIALQITATTPHGVVLSRPWGVALDGLLASVLWHRRKWAARAAGVPFAYDHNEFPEDLDLPLARCGDPDADPDWHWMATFADLYPRCDSGTDIRWRTSRTDRSRLQHLCTSIGSQAVSDSAGRYQRRVVPVIAHPVTTLTWRAVGDPERIADLLTDLPSIGKHRGVGEGLVSKWEVIETPEAPLWEAGHEHEPGVLGRTVPERCVHHRGELAVGALGAATVRPPYIHPASRTQAYAPAR
ncbi:hypothetical protein I549_4316 [Mycobacterium avium subsp. avium 2285 (R)]|nr:hypothetical protein I549_4316 [Mycobacterium avium subsp. avium 2285 (R)]